MVVDFPTCTTCSWFWEFHFIFLNQYMTSSQMYHSSHGFLGPSAISMDFSFTGFDHVYGIPEHADSLALKQTT